jgi:hypothetical protein
MLSSLTLNCGLVYLRFLRARFVLFESNVNHEEGLQLSCHPRVMTSSKVVHKHLSEVGWRFLWSSSHTVCSTGCCTNMVVCGLVWDPAQQCVWLNIVVRTKEVVVDNTPFVQQLFYPCSLLPFPFSGFVTLQNKQWLLVSTASGILPWLTTNELQLCVGTYLLHGAESFLRS